MKQNNQPRPTPETDEAEINLGSACGQFSEWYVKPDFARKLERERDEAREQIQMMLKHDANRLESDSIVGSCDCLTKTPEVKYHKPGCKYRLISERDEAREELEAMREAIKEAYEVRIKMAEAMGWKHVEVYEWINDVRTPKQWADFDVLPNYPEDLNACAEFEATLTDEEWDVYCENLGGSLRSCASAAPLQRCLAYLKTKRLIP